MRGSRAILTRQAELARAPEYPIVELAPARTTSETPATAAAPPPRLVRYLPQVLVATFAVVLCPLLIVSGLRAVGVLRSIGVSIPLGVVLSLGASLCGNAIWRSRPGSGDLLFGELMLWGWLRRVWIERQLTSALRLLDGVGGDEALSVERRKELLTKLAAALEARDPYTHGHSRRVARTATMIATRMGLPNSEIAKVRTAAILHDVGKVNTPLAVLHKPGRLTDDEFEVIKQHPVDGATMVSSLGDAALAAMVRHHHERLDGTGYPDRLRGDRIPLGARIIAVADTFDAITSARPYRGASPHKKAIAILAAEAGTQLDPTAVRAFDSYYAGRRPLALWAGMANAVEPLVSWLSAGLSAASSGAVGPMVALATLTGVAGGAIAGSQLAPPAPSRNADRAGLIARAPLGPQGHQARSSLPPAGPSSTVKRGGRGGRRRGHGSMVHGGRGSHGAGHGAGVGRGALGGKAGAGASSHGGAGSSTGSRGPSTGGGGTSTGGGGTSTGGGSTSVSVGGSTVTTGSGGPSVSAGGASVSTGGGSGSVTVGGSSVQSGSGGPSVSVGGSGVTVGG